MDWSAPVPALGQVEDAEVGVLAGAEVIADAERRLGVAFPASYRAFLATLGWIEGANVQVNGLGDGVPSDLNLILETERERTDLRPFIPTHLISIWNDGTGSHYCLDLARARDGDCPVVYWEHELDGDQQPETVAKAFEAWLVGRIEEARAWQDRDD